MSGLFRRHPPVAASDGPNAGPRAFATASAPLAARTTPDWTTLGSLVALAIAAVLIRWPFFSVPLITDEGGYAYVARHWTGQSRLYREIPFGRPEGIFLLYKLIFATLGGDTIAIRVFAALYNAATTLALFGLARGVFGARAAWISAASYALLSSSPVIEGFTANAEIFTLLPLVLAAWALWRRRWFWAGLLTAIATNLKPSGIEGGVFGLLWLAFTRPGWRALLAFGLGGLLGVVPSLLHGLAIGWSHYWYAMVLMRREVYAPEVVALGATLKRLWVGVSATCSAWALPALLFAGAALQPLGDARPFALAWLVSAVVGMALGVWWDWHFFIQLLPPLCFLAGVGALKLWQRRERWVWATIATAAVAFFALRNAPYWTYDPLRASWELYHRPGYVFSEPLAKYIQAHTQPGEPIYVAFSQADLYYLADRPAAVPEQLYYAVARYSPRAFAKVVAALEQRAPALVVVAQPPPINRMSLEDFNALLARGYVFAERFGNLQVWRRRSPQELAPASGEQGS